MGAKCPLLGYHCRLVRTLFWYKNTDTPGLPQFSTDTYKAVLNAGGTPFTEVIGKITRMTLSGGQQVFVSVNTSVKLFLRTNLAGELQIKQTPTQISSPPSGIKGAFAGNLDGQPGDEQ